LGFPIVGDTINGRAPRTGGPTRPLHARYGVGPNTTNTPPVTITAPVPPHMRELLSKCGWKGQA
jgi:tRNA pseudouridine32 synthase/23S rRNA pseudouridine746 synthase